MASRKKPAPKSPRRRAAADWETIERDYRAGIKSIRQIAKEQGISHTAIQKKAESEQWTRDLAGKIRAAADAKLAREVATPKVATEVARATERDIVEANAEIQVQIVREHRGNIQRARGLTQQLLDDLSNAMSGRLILQEIIIEETAGDRSPKRRNFLMGAVSLGEHASTLESVTRSLKNLIALERQAFGIDDQAPTDPEDTYEARLKRLYEQAKQPIEGEYREVADGQA